MRPSDLDHLESILDLLRCMERVEEVENEQEWLYDFINMHPITILRRDLVMINGVANEQAATLEVLKHDYQLAKAGVDSLKHLQKYEGMAITESNNLGHQAEVTMLKAKIAELQERLNHG